MGAPKESERDDRWGQAPTLADAGQSSATPPASGLGDGVPRTIGRYVVLRRIGRGGMGSVFSAYDEKLDRRVAIKLLHQAQAQTQSGDTQGRARLYREAQALARLGHPNVVYVYEVGEVGAQLFLAMEHIAGSTLAEWQAKEKRPWLEVLRMYLAAGRGLLAAHEAGLVHRDFKPENVIVAEDGRPRVVDFGLARAHAELEAPAPRPAASPGLSSSLDGSLTQAGTIMGTPFYMSPEQCCGEEVDSRSDQFSYCAALYEALYGVRPFVSETIEGMRGKLLFGTVPPPPKDSAVPAQIYKTLQRGLSREPKDRFPSMRELLAALDVDPARHSAVDQQSGLRIALAVSAALLVYLVGFYYMLLTRGMSFALLQLSMGILLLSGVVGGVLTLGTLKQYAFHRGMYVTLMGGMGLNLTLAILGERMVVPLAFMGVVAMTNIGCMYALMAYQYVRLLWVCAALTWCTSLTLGLMAASLTQVRIAMQIVYPATTLLLALAWFRSTRQK